MTVSPENLYDLDAFGQAAATLLDPAILNLIDGGAGTGAAIRRNRAAWGRWALRSRALRDVSTCAMQTTLLGTEVALPVLLAPSGLHGLAHPEAERATARTALAADTLMVLSMNSTLPVEEVAEEGAKLWFQLYWGVERDFLRDVMARAAASGCRAFCLTVDFPVRPWLHGAMRAALGAVGDIQPAHGFPRNSHLGAQTRWDHDARLTWADLAWLRAHSPLPIILKGIMGAEDARLAVEHGADGIIVSNHGGRVLEDGLATAEVLADVAAAVDGRIEVLVDGGIRTGSDVAKALALGARAALIGRPALWGLTVGGAAGLERVIALLQGELASVMGMTGCRTLADLGPDMLVERR